jgi:UDP-glucose 4-epimerase
MPALEGVAWVLGDVTDAESCRALFRRYPSEAVVHCAARISVPESCRDPLGYYHHNTAGSATVMDVGREYGVRRWVLSSTAAVYGEGFGNRPIEETMPLIPVNPYGASKMMAEKVWEDGCRAHAMRGVALRYFNVSGADPQGRAGQWDPESGHLITRLLRVALGQQPIFRIFGQDYPTEDGTCVRDYIHVSDLARAHAMALESLQNPAMAESSPLVSGGEWSVYNVGLGRGYSVKQVWEAAERVIGRSIPCEWGPRREGDPARLVASSEAIRRDWGWNPAHAEIESMVSSAWDWMQRWHGAGSSKQCVTT